MASAENRNPRASGGWMGCNVDFGDERVLELEYDEVNGPWLSNGAGIMRADIWFAGRDGLPDIRVRIERTPSGIQVHMDRGQQSDAWWSPESPPRLTLAFEPRARIVTASASVGMGEEFQEVNLGFAAF